MDKQVNNKDTLLQGNQAANDERVNGQKTILKWRRVKFVASGQISMLSSQPFKILGDLKAWQK